MITIPSDEVKKFEEEKNKLKEALDGLIALLEERNNQGRHRPAPLI